MGVLNRKRPPPDLASQIETAVARALGQQAKATPAQQPAKLTALMHRLSMATAEPAPAPRSTPTPPPARQPPSLTSIALQRDSNGKIAAVTVAASNGSRHHLAARRDQFGRMNAVVVDDHTMWRVERGYNDQIAGLTPIEHDK